jgi:hypothetical protein
MATLSDATEALMVYFGYLLTGFQPPCPAGAATQVSAQRPAG